MAAPIELADVCVYTTISPEKLLEAAREHKSLTETRRWTPTRLLLPRLRLYAVVLLASILLVSGATSQLSGEELLQLFQAPRILPLIVGLYALRVTICL